MFETKQDVRPRFQQSIGLPDDKLLDSEDAVGYLLLRSCYISLHRDSLQL